MLRILACLSLSLVFSGCSVLEKTVKYETLKKDRSGFYCGEPGEERVCVSADELERIILLDEI